MIDEPLICSQGGIPYNKPHLDAKDAEIERLRHRNAALVEIVRDSRCPSDGRATVGECQQCGCSHGLMIRATT